MFVVPDLWVHSTDFQSSWVMMISSKQLTQGNLENEGKFHIALCILHCQVWLSSVGLVDTGESIQTITGRSSTVTGFTDDFMVIFSSHINHALLSGSLSAVLHIQFVFPVQSDRVFHPWCIGPAAPLSGSAPAKLHRHYRLNTHSVVSKLRHQ